MGDGQMVTVTLNSGELKKTSALIESCPDTVSISGRLREHVQWTVESPNSRTDTATGQWKSLSPYIISYIFSTIKCNYQCHYLSDY